MDLTKKFLGCNFNQGSLAQESAIIAGSLESADSSILAARRLFKDFGGEKIRILC